MPEYYGMKQRITIYKTLPYIHLPKNYVAQIFYVYNEMAQGVSCCVFEKPQKYPALTMASFHTRLTVEQIWLFTSIAFIF